jgi:hypothetical protein
MNEALRIEDQELRLTESQVIPLLHSLCVDLGFCFSVDVADSFESDPPRTVETFTNAIFLAEGLSPDLSDRMLYAQVRAVVAAAFERAARNGV